METPVKRGPGRPRGSKNRQPFNITKSIFETASQEENLKLLKEAYINMLKMATSTEEAIPPAARIRAFEVAYRTVGVSPKEFLEFLGDSEDVDVKIRMLELMTHITGEEASEPEQI